MLTTSSRLRIQEILMRLSMGKEVTLEERIYINKYATKNQNVSSWLRKASRIQRNQTSNNSIDELLNDNFSFQDDKEEKLIAELARLTTLLVMYEDKELYEKAAIIKNKIRIINKKLKNL